MLIDVCLIRSMQRETERDKERQRETKRDRERDNHATLFNVGSCGLHSIHGDFETAMTSNQ